MSSTVLNVETLSQKELIQLFYDTVQEKDKVLAEKEEALRQNAFFIEKLQHQIEKLERWRFGKRSEKVAVGQLHLFELKKPLPEHISETDIIEDKPEPKKKPKRQKVQENLPRETVEYSIPEADLSCGKCGNTLEKIGEEISEQYDYVPARLKARKTVRHKYGCRNKKCKGEVKLADAPAQIIPKGNATAGLLSHILVSKYQDHLPLYRQCEIFRRHGVEFSRSMLSDWVLACGEILQSIVHFMEGKILESKAIHTDDTVIPVLDPGRKRTRQGRLWVYIGDPDHPYTTFRYSPDRKGEHPQNFLKSYGGFIHADAFSGYDALFDRVTGGVAIEVACWAHARRKFFEATDHPEGSRELWFIRQLYLIEKEVKSLSAEDRKKHRQKKSKPVLDQFKDWLENLYPFT